MKSEKFSLRVPRTARIFQCGNENTPEALIVLHGYGFLAEYFIKHFEHLPEIYPKMSVYAPEGLSRFYKEGFYGNVGASWMTKEDRLSEIQDQQEYLDLVVEHIHQHNPQTRIHVLGFSQGVATAWRWILNGSVQPASFVLWAGEVPSEYSAGFMQKLQDCSLYHVCGTEDEFIPPELEENQYLKLLSHFPGLKKRNFTGKHTLNQALLTEIYHEVLYAEPSSKP
ncbi:MAG: phospholipase [Bacteroidia bacterium]|nr:phospholipase [Bacteroidia bacterium]